jgi:A/G-specific adenine glycosylase
MSNATGRALLAWFDEHRRDLPWRRTRDPYAIWVSEIMLQQTRVAAVLEHYARWMQRFPTIAALAEASEDEVLALWSGLGYYRRARMLHRAAQTVVAERGGRMPETAAELRTLPGIGEYTSAAIASIAFGETIPVVDGNVERIVTRIFSLAPARGDTLPAAAKGDQAVLARAIRDHVRTLLSEERPGDANQAMMELGATVCLPRAPLCLYCPLELWCQTRGEHVVPKRKPPVARDIFYAFATRQGKHGQEVLLQQRAGDASLMAGMWELPEIAAPAAEAEVLLRLRHAITVTNYTVRVLPSHQRSTNDRQAWIARDALSVLPLTGLARKVLRRLGKL